MGTTRLDMFKEHCRQWENLAVFPLLRDENILQEYLKTYLGHSYLINRFIFPSLGTHLFSEVQNSPPIDESNGKTIKFIMETLVGELCNNNVFQRDNECHSHYQDYREAYLSAGGKESPLQEFSALERNVGFRKAIQQSSLWTKSLCEYTGKLLGALQEPTSSYLINGVLEEYLHKQFQASLIYIPHEKKFDKVRTFFQRHIEFDEGEHGPAMQTFVEEFLENKPNALVEGSILKTIEVIKAYTATYDLKKLCEKYDC